MRQKGLIRLDSSDLIALPSRPMFPGWFSVGLVILSKRGSEGETGGL